MGIENVLEKMGLSQNEIKVYLALNDNGSSKAGDAAKITKMDRSSCYNSLKSLTERGIISSVTIRKVKWFQAIEPDGLLEYVKEQEEDIKKIIPELRKRYNVRKVEGHIKLFKGVNGIKNIFMDIIKTGENNYVFGDEGQFIKRMPNFVMRFDRLKKENKIETKLIINKRPKELQPTETEFRYFENIGESPAVTNIYGNKIAITVWTDEPEGIIIENEAVAKAYKSYFDILWKYGKSKK